MNKNIQEFVNHSDFTTYVFTTKRKSDDRWELSSKEGNQRFYIKLHTKEIRIKDEKKNKSYTIPIADIISYLRSPFFNVLSVTLKRRIYRGYNDYVFSVGVPSTLKSNNIVMHQYNECSNESHSDIVKYHEIVFMSPDNQRDCYITIPQKVFEEMLARQWEYLRDLQKYTIGCYLGYNRDIRYNLFVENMASHPVLLKLKELYMNDALAQSIYGVDNFVQIKFKNNTNISDVIFGVPPSGKDNYVSISEFSGKCCITNYTLTMPRSIWAYLADRIYWLNEMFTTLGISKCLKLNNPNT